MLVQKLSNGQIQVTQANLILTHTDFHGLKINSSVLKVQTKDLNLYSLP